MGNPGVEVLGGRPGAVQRDKAFRCGGAGGGGRGGGRDLQSSGVLSVAHCQAAFWPFS